MTVRTKIETRLDALEEALQAGEHLKSAEGVLYTLILIQHASKFWRVLTDEERKDDFAVCRLFEVTAQQFSN